MLSFLYSKNLKFKDIVLTMPPKNIKKVDDVNSSQVSNIIDEFKPDMLVISGTKKVKNEILKKVEIKLNLHHGIVPFYRGVSSASWVIQERDFGNFGITIHEATNTLDAGKVLVCEKLTPFKGEPLKLFRAELFAEGYLSLTKSIISIIEKT